MTQNFIKQVIDKKYAKLYVILAVVVLALIFVIYWGPKRTLAPSQEPGQNGETQEKTEQKPTTSAKPSITQTISYNEALQIYIDKRIQFDENCLVNPSYTTFKKGTKIMLDNRASKARPVYLDGQVYNLSVYGFKIVTLTTASPLPHTIMIDCGNGKNNGRILLQQ